MSCAHGICDIQQICSLFTEFYVSWIVCIICTPVMNDNKDLILDIQQIHTLYMCDIHLAIRCDIHQIRTLDVSQ